MLNNEIAVTGNRYTEGDEVVVDGSLLKPADKEKMVIMAFNKPIGITTTTDTNIRGNIISFINYPKRIFPIGRLDKESEGLIFLTNNGDIVNKILRAGNEHEKEYLVRVDRNVDGAFLRSMSEGVRIDGVKTLPCRVKQTGKHSFSIILVQGLNRQIRKMCEALGHKVTSLQRVRIMDITLGKIPVGKWRYLSEPEIESLNKATAASASDSKGKTYERPIKEMRKQKAGSTQDQESSGAARGLERASSEGENKAMVKPAGRRVGPTKAVKSSSKVSSYKDFRKKGKKK
jgi:23S rRNA pseudouridine2604 synthase